MLDQPERPELTLTRPAAAAVRLAYRAARQVLEYGSGGSTVVAAEAGTPVFSVECDPVWAARMRRWFDSNPPKGQVVLHEVDIGPVGAWASPTDPETADRWPAYPQSVWDRPDFVQPDVVLIDGRFRVACLLTTALRTRRPVTVLFDDYAPRRIYHVVERLFRPVAMHGRMAQFDIAPTRRLPRQDWIAASFRQPM